MSVEFGAGSTGDDLMAEALRDAGRHVFAYLYETYAARLFDYCEGILDDEVAATIAVQDSLVTVDSKIAKLPDPDQLRVQLYSIARRQCLSMMSRGRVKAAQASAPDAFAAGQADRAPGEGASTQLAAAALSALGERDREVLNLAFRHGIEGGDLAAVLGVSSRRSRAMLSDAVTRFRQEAARRAGERSDQVVGPEMLAKIPLAKPPLTLRLRLTRTALALGSSRSGRAGPAGGDAAGVRVIRVRRRASSGRGLPHVVVVSSLGLIILAVPGAMLYKLANGSGAGPVAARMDSGIQGPAPTIAPPSLAGFDPGGSVRQRGRLALPGFGPAPLGVLPSPSPPHQGAPPTSVPPSTSQPGSPPPTSSRPTTSPPTTPPPTTPPPTTPPPTTPPPTTPPPTTPPPTTPPPTTAPPTTAPPTGGTPTPSA
jgi:DNA-directed RNA polymerase specialized sigma24 family protein